MCVIFVKLISGRPDLVPPSPIHSTFPLPFLLIAFESIYQLDDSNGTRTRAAPTVSTYVLVLRQLSFVFFEQIQRYSNRTMQAKLSPSG